MVRAADLDAVLAKGAAAVRARPRRQPLPRAPARLARAAARMRHSPRALTASRLASRAPQWEAADNKPVLAGYGVGLLVGLYFVESLIHLPVLNLVIGFPLELLGVMSAGALALRYLKQGGDAEADVSAVAASLADTLPGLKK